MICELCEKILKNKAGHSYHFKNCKIDYELKNDIIDLYINKLLSIEKICKILNTHTNRVRRVLDKKIRSNSESGKIAHKLYPDSFKHSEETKTKIRRKRLEYMKNNPDKTAWRLSNMSYPEKIFLEKLKELKWDQKYLIVREKSIFPYFIDFAFINEKVAVEIDGSQHNLPDRIKSDKKKDKLLMDDGWKIIHITAKIINEDIDKAIFEIKKFLYEHNNYKKVGIFYSKFNKKKRKDKIKKQCMCGKEISNKSNSCIKCHSNENRKVERPSYEQLIKEIDKLGYLGTGRKYGVSDNSIRKWKKYYENTNIS